MEKYVNKNFLNYLKLILTINLNLKIIIHLYNKTSTTQALHSKLRASNSYNSNCEKSCLIKMNF